MKYLITLTDDIVLGKTTLIIEANNEEMALEIFFSNLLFYESDFFADYISSKYYGFAKDLQLDTESSFEENVFNFFEDNLEYALIFLEEYKHSIGILSLPEQIIGYISEKIAPDFFPEVQIANIEDIEVTPNKRPYLYDSSLRTPSISIKGWIREKIVSV